MATHANFKDFVLSTGLEFFPLGGDAKVLADCKYSDYFPFVFASHLANYSNEYISSLKVNKKKEERFLNYCVRDMPIFLKKYAEMQILKLFIFFFLNIKNKK